MKMAVGNVTAITKEHYEGAVVSERQWIHVIQKGNRRGAKGNPPVLKECLQDIAETYYDDIYRFCAFHMIWHRKPFSGSYGMWKVITTVI